MANFSNTSRPAYVWDGVNNQWVPVGVGPHTHSVADVANAATVTTYTAKGDLALGTGASTVGTLNVGADGTTLVANSSASTGVAWAGPSLAGGKNWLINGNFDIWQRGTSTSSLGVYLADRWVVATFSGGGTFSQNTSLVPSNAQNSITYTCATSGNPIILQAIETLNSIYLAGQTVTVSAYLATSAAQSVDIHIEYSTTVDAAWNAGTYSGLTQTVSTTSSLVKKTATTTIPSNAKTVRVYFTTTAAMSASATLTVAQVQLELGSVATAFSRAGGTLQGELNACQRYYYKRNGTSLNGLYPPLAQGSAYSTTQAEVTIFFPVPMRVGPTAVESPTTVSYLALWDGVTLTALNAAPTIPGGGSGIDGARLYAPVASGLTQYRPYTLLNNNVAGGYLAFSAEL